MDARGWLLEYARSHGDSSPLNDKIWLPAGRRGYYYATYYSDRVSKGVEAKTVASLKTFLKVWREELPFITIRTANGPFTHCGLCEYLKLCAVSCQDMTLRSQIILRLGQHHAFQGAQRIAMTNIFMESERNPLELFAVAWDKMDQTKTIIPRVPGLKNTAFVKTGARLVVSLVGVIAPAVWRRPLFYTTLENYSHGSDMIGSLMVDVLLDAARSIGSVPRRYFIQADNTAKETKNTITIFMALWLLAKLESTRLEVVEFGYLIVGHTHDLVDTLFSFVNKALAQATCLSLPEMFKVLETSMRNPPIWKHLTDVYMMKDLQPQYLKASNVRGTRAPHHYRLFRDRNKALCIQSKRFLTSETWTPSVVLCTFDQAQQLARIDPSLFQPSWDASFQASAINWVARLKALLAAAKVEDLSGLDHTLALLKDELPEYLPSGTPVESKIAELRQIDKAARRKLSVADQCCSNALQGVQEASSKAFPGSVQPLVDDGRPLINTFGNQAAGSVGYRQEDIAENMMVMFRNKGLEAQQLPFRLGKVLRVAAESAADRYVVIETWWPLLKPDKFGQLLNAFGTWVPCAAPVEMESNKSKKQRRSQCQQLPQNANKEIVNSQDLLVWPVELEEGWASGMTAGRIPFSAFDYIGVHFDIDMTKPEHAFAERGKAYVNAATTA